MTREDILIECLVNLVLDIVPFALVLGTAGFMLVGTFH